MLLCLRFCLDTALKADGKLSIYTLRYQRIRMAKWHGLYPTRIVNKFPHIPSGIEHNLWFKFQ